MGVLPVGCGHEIAAKNGDLDKVALSGIALWHRLFLPSAFFPLARADKDSATGNQMSAKRCLVVAAVVLPTLFPLQGLVCFEVTTCTGCA